LLLLIDLLPLLPIPGTFERPTIRPNDAPEATDKAQWGQGIQKGLQHCRNTQIANEIKDIPKVYL